MLRDGEVTTVDNVEVADELQPLYDYLGRRGSFVDLDNYKPDYLPILSRDVLSGSRPRTRPGSRWCRRRSAS